jgi:sulfopyruvate decarboxylase TPP-binding subunit
MNILYMKCGRTVVIVQSVNILYVVIKVPSIRLLEKVPFLIVISHTDAEFDYVTRERTL